MVSLLLWLPAMSAAAEAASDSLAPCSRIAEVRVPDELHVDADLVVYAPRNAPRISVTAETVQWGGRHFRDPSVRSYHAALHAFLGESGRRASVARSMLNRGRYAQAASAMCRRVLALEAAGRTVERKFPGFVSPVRIRLR
jgi:hypothetical protein